jgi:hypothetical protein
MDFEPAQGGGVAGQGSGSELCRGDEDFSLCQEGSFSGLRRRLAGFCALGDE